MSPASRGDASLAACQPPGRDSAFLNVTSAGPASAVQPPRQKGLDGIGKRCRLGWPHLQDQRRPQNRPQPLGRRPGRPPGLVQAIPQHGQRCCRAGAAGLRLNRNNQPPRPWVSAANSSNNPSAWRQRHRNRTGESDFGFRAVRTMPDPSPASAPDLLRRLIWKPGRGWHVAVFRDALFEMPFNTTNRTSPPQPRAGAWRTGSVVPATAHLDGLHGPQSSASAPGRGDKSVVNGGRRCC